jgi:hypothetical protein
MVNMGHPSNGAQRGSIDTTVNDAFLRSLARQQRGGCWLQTPDDDITGTIAALGDRLRRPVMTELSVRGGWEVSRPTWPDLHAREVVTIALRGNAMHPLEITGRLPDGRMHRLDVELGLSGSEAVKLLWANERIATLIESGRRQEAIALAKQHNLICDGAAFIAWDEAERVQVAQQEIVQPCLEPTPTAALRNMAYFAAPMPSPCSTLDASAEYAAPQACRSGGRNLVGEGMTNLQSTTAQDLVNRRITAVREFLQDESVAKSIIAAAVAWALADETLERLRTLEDAIEFAAEFRRRPESPITKEILERGFRAALASSSRDLVQWTESTRRALQLLAELTPGLRHAQAPDVVIDHLFAWVMETGEIAPDRQERLRTFVASLGQLPFSVESKARHWRAFLYASFSQDSRAWIAADSWIHEVETATSVKGT